MSLGLLLQLAIDPGALRPGEDRFDIGFAFGNILFGGIIGMVIVAPLTGAMWKLPEMVQVRSRPSLYSAERTSWVTWAGFP